MIGRVFRARPRGTLRAERVSVDDAQILLSCRLRFAQNSTIETWGGTDTPKVTERPALDGRAISGSSSGTALTVLTLQNLPKGTYVVTGQISANTSGTTDSRVICRTTLGSVTTQALVNIGSASGNVGQSTLPVAFKSTIGATSDATISCWAESLTGGAPFIGDDGTRLVAIKV